MPQVPLRRENVRIVESSYLVLVLSSSCGIPDTRVNHPLRSVAWKPAQALLSTYLRAGLVFLGRGCRGIALGPWFQRRLLPLRGWSPLSGRLSCADLTVRNCVKIASTMARGYPSRRQTCPTKKAFTCRTYHDLTDMSIVQIIYIVPHLPSWYVVQDLCVHSKASNPESHALDLAGMCGYNHSATSAI